MMSSSPLSAFSSDFNLGLCMHRPCRGVFSLPSSAVHPPPHLSTMSMVSSSQHAGTKKRQRTPSKKRSPGKKGNALKDRSIQNNLQRETVQKKKLEFHEAKSMGEAIQLAQTIADHLNIADKFIWLPTDNNLPSHLRTQLVHHEKRRRWGGQLLESLGQAALNDWENNPREVLRSLSAENIWGDKRLLKIISSVALPMKDSSDRPEKEGVWISQALKGLYVLSGCIAPVAPTSAHELDVWMNIHRCISKLIQSADELFTAQNTLLKDAVEVRWAIRGLVCRLQIANNALPDNIMETEATETILFTTPNLNVRTSYLPFDILPHCVPWQMNPIANELQYNGYPTHDVIPDLISAIPFNFDTLTTRSGNSVLERRGTAWLAEEGIGALAYSGKLMPPAEVPDVVRGIMRDIEQWCHQSGRSSLSQLPLVQNIGGNLELIWDDSTSNDLPYVELGQFIQQPSYSSPIVDGFFDCALCNHYPDGESACKFHTDPEHGSHWHRVTAVVSCGQSRKFAFRPIPEKSIWNEWEDASNSKQQKDDTSCAPAALSLFPGDVVLMTRDCNDLFHHAVYSSPGALNNQQMDSSRVSLVFKRALDRNGKKGHGLKGEGRRARRNLI